MNLYKDQVVCMEFPCLHPWNYYCYYACYSIVQLLDPDIIKVIRLAGSRSLNSYVK